jgi:Ca-activated chloride channel homolog
MLKKLTFGLFAVIVVLPMAIFPQSTVEVKANVLVLDSKAQFIDDLKLEDFKIFEDGVEQKLRKLVKKEPVLNLGLVIDNSNSIRMQLYDVIFFGQTIAENLQPRDEAFVVRFISTDKISIEQDWTSSKYKIQDALNNLYTEGGKTAMIDALYLAANKLIEREKVNKSNRYALVLISDGLDRASYYKLDVLFALTKPSDLQIFTFLFSEEEALAQIKSQTRIKGEKYLMLHNILATETGGTAFMLTKKYSKDEVNKKLNELMTELRSNYVVEYTSSNSKRDGKPRSLRVEITNGANGEKRTGSIRQSYVATDEKNITK